MSRRHRLAIRQLNAERQTRRLIAKDEKHPGWYRHTEWDTTGPKTYIINLRAVQVLRAQLGLKPLGQT